MTKRYLGSRSDKAIGYTVRTYSMYSMYSIRLHAKEHIAVRHCHIAYSTFARRISKDSNMMDLSPEDLGSDTGTCPNRTSTPLSVKAFMQEFPGYPHSISELLVNCPFGTGAALVKLKCDGFVITEEDPLIHAVIDCNNDDSVRNYNGGNFAVNPGFAGWLPWPEGAPPAPGAALPDGVEKTPPAALGRFIAQQPGVTNKSSSFTLFAMNGNETVHRVKSAITGTRQFLRISAHTAALVGVPPSASPVSFIQLDSVDGRPQMLSNYTDL